MQQIPIKIQNSLLDWFSHHQRKVPWRLETSTHRNPYFVWVSEIMLQQTRVEAVIPFFKKWILKFPTLQKLAQANEEDVLSCWAGLGYYSRARNLQKGAKFIIQEFSGELPSDPVSLEKIPGIGPYTAGAISSLAYNQKVPIVDGNIVRIFSRLYSWNFRMETSVKHKVQYWEQAKVWAQRSPKKTNEAMMELGALICTPKSPKCNHCPVEKICTSRSNNEVGLYPPSKQKKPKINVLGCIVLFKHKKQYLLVKPKPKELLHNLWTLPLFEKSPIEIQKLYANAEFYSEISHAITNHKIKLKPVLVELPSKQFDKTPFLATKWVTKGDLPEAFQSSLPKKGFEKIFSN